MYYTAWEKGRLVRKEFHLTSDVQYAIGFGFTCTLLGGLLVLFLMSGCGDGAFSPELEPAREAWGALEMCPVELRVRSEERIYDECAGHLAPEGYVLEGCSKIAECRIYVVSGLSDERLTQVLLHEMGHIIRGHHGHLACDLPGADIMCPDGAYGTSLAAPTERDQAFVWQARD